MMWDGGMGSGMGWMWVFWLLLVLGTVLLVFVLVKALSGSSGGASRQGGSTRSPTGVGPQQAREILDERYARGEIDTQEYQERRQALEGGAR